MKRYKRHRTLIRYGVLCFFCIVFFIKEDFIMTKTNDFLEKEGLGRLMRKYTVPCVISLLAAALYNMVDQLYIANADYLGSYGNAANTVVFPMTVIEWRWL